MKTPAVFEAEAKRLGLMNLVRNLSQALVDDAMKSRKAQKAQVKKKPEETEETEEEKEIAAKRQETPE